MISAMTTFESSEDFEEPALDWLFHEVESLRSSLIDGGIVDDEIQRKVCEQYIFGLAGRLDGSEIRDPQAPLPTLGFLSANQALMADDSFSFHEYALGLVGEAFGDV